MLRCLSSHGKAKLLSSIGIRILKSKESNIFNMIRITVILPLTGVTKKIGGDLSNGIATADDLLLNPLDDPDGEGAIL